MRSCTAKYNELTFANFAKLKAEGRYRFYTSSRWRAMAHTGLGIRPGFNPKKVCRMSFPFCQLSESELLGNFFREPVCKDLNSPPRWKNNLEMEEQPSSR
jgi:hypothetical protein